MGTMITADDIADVPALAQAIATLVREVRQAKKASGEGGRRVTKAERRIVTSAALAVVAAAIEVVD